MEIPPGKLDTIRCEIRERLLAMRCLERLITSPEFAAVFEAACPECQDEAERFIAQEDAAALRRWIAKQQTNVNYGELPLRELRVVAQRLGVPFYSRLAKATLLSEIKKYDDARKGIT